MSDERTIEQRPEGWDASAEHYDEVASQISNEIAPLLCDLAGVREGLRVLDVGAGPGTVALVAAERGANVTAVDFSPGMIARLHRNAEERGVEVDAEVMDGQALTFDDDTFDAAVSSFAVIFFPRREDGFSEMNRVVKNSGTVAVSVWSTPDRMDFFQVIAEGVQRALPDLPSRPPPDWLAIASPDGLRKAMLDAGAAEVEVHTENITWEIPSGAWLRERFREMSPAARGLLDGLPPEDQERVLDSIQEVLEDRFGTGPVTLENEAHIGVATPG
ncbi:MAG: class I SAM-dependent methyltransferase [Nitriliruptorales bacterium]|nr:class I SAM-dependent methyltransferase [Nitriliruptorales bacterium]